MIIDDNDKTVTCRVCGKQCARIFGKHLKSHGMTTNEYKKLFPDAPLMSSTDKLNLCKNSGIHMKEEKYKKIFSEKYKGEKNPNHKSRTTEDERKRRSPFSKKFVKYENINNVDEELSKFLNRALKDRINTTSIEYYLNLGYSIEESKKMLKERQTTFSKKICIDKYGEEKGIEIWQKRQNNWQKSLIENGNIKCGYSRVSQELFYSILKEYDCNLHDMNKIYFATKNREYFIAREDDNGFYAYDFVDLNLMKIIEYNGDQYHANPNIYDSTDYPHPYYKEKGYTALDIWDKDFNKIEMAKKEGFDIIVIWDSEYKKNKKETIKKCIDFLKNSQ